MLDCTYTIWRCSSWKYCCSCFIKVRFIIIIQFRKFVEGINGTSCSIFKLYKTTIDGEEKESKPKWIGIDELIQTLDSTQDNIINIKNDVKSLHEFQGTSEGHFDTLFNYASNNFSEKQKNYIEGKIIQDYSIGYSKPSTIVPNYINNFTSYLQNLEIEKTQVIEFGNAFIQRVKDASYQLYTNFDEVLTTVNDAQNEILDLKTTFTDLADDVLDDWVKYQDYVNDYANLIFYILTGLMMAFGVAGFICTFFYASFDKCQCLRIILHFVWNFLALFTFILLLLGSVFGLLGTIGSDGVGVMEYAFTDNLKDEDPIIIKGEALDYIDECMNLEGDLYNRLNFSDNAKDINEIYKLNKELETVSLTLDTYTTFNTTKKQRELYLNMAAISLTDDKIKQDLDDVNKDTETNYHDKWVENKGNCGNYPYLKITDNLSLQKTACFVINDYFTGNDVTENIKSRYNNQTIEQKIIDLINYGKTNTQYLTNKKKENDDLDNASGKIIQEIKDQRDLAKNIITPLNATYSDLIGDNGIETLMNCKFMGNNINIFFDQMDNGLSGHATSFAISTLFSACCAGLSNLFVLLVIHKFRKAPEPEVKPTEENESFKPEQKPTEEAPAVATHPVDINETEHPINPSDVKIEMTDQA